MISFLTNQLAVFSPADKHLWFSEGFSAVSLSFGLLGVLSWSFRESKLGLFQNGDKLKQICRDDR